MMKILVRKTALPLAMVTAKIGMLQFAFIILPMFKLNKKF